MIRIDVIGMQGIPIVDIEAFILEDEGRKQGRGEDQMHWGLGFRVLYNLLYPKYHIMCQNLLQESFFVHIFTRPSGLQGWGGASHLPAALEP